MSSTVTKTVGVSELSKYGFKNVAGQYVNWSKKIPEASKGLVVPGGNYEMDIFVADSGKEYVNEVRALKVVAPVKVTTNPVPTPVTVILPTPGKSFVAKAIAKATGDAMSKDEWSEKDKRIGRAGVIQVAVQINADFDEAVKLADKMLKYIWTNNVNQA